MSVQGVHDAYVRYDTHYGEEPDDPRHAHLLDLAEREDANSLSVMNALLEEDDSTQANGAGLRTTCIGDELRAISPDLDARWRGVVFAQSSESPDAARHFCTSAREVFAQMLDLRAPNYDVLSELPTCEKTQEGHPTRRAKIRYVLKKKGLASDTLEDFIQKDVDNVLELFGVFNSATHGPAGRYDIGKLSAIKVRVEEGLMFLSNVVS